MNNSLKLTTAALLVLGSTQASATDFELDISNTITQTIKSYVQQASIELKQSVNKSIEFDAQKLLESYMGDADTASKEAVTLAAKTSEVTNKQ